MSHSGKRFIFATISLLVLGIVLLGVATPSKASAAPVGAGIGFVDYSQLINGHPETPKANEILKAEQEQAKKEFADKSTGLSEQEKKDLDRQLGQRLEQKRQELLKAITDKINIAIKEVADAKGISVVFGKNTIVYGGVDITADVLNKLNGK